MEWSTGALMDSRTIASWDTTELRRAVRLICSHSPRITDTQATARALRLILDIAQRRGAPTDAFQLPGTMPLITIGNGPILLITHLDDPHPLAQVDNVGLPSISGNTVTVPGITRKAGVLAALGAFLGGEATAERCTLIIETDRHQGSESFAKWFDSSERHINAALYDVVDLPVPAPAIFLSATGTVTLRISVQRTGQVVERHYGGVQSDIGHALLAAISSLKSVDGEVLVPGFYDDVITPGPEGLAAIGRVSSTVGHWLTNGTSPDTDQLSPDHLTLGAFLAPSLILRELSLRSDDPYLVSSASAIVEAQIMPGQNAGTIARSISGAIESRIEDATIEARLLLQPVQASFDTKAFADIANVLPVAPGPSPIGTLSTSGIPTLGFSTTWRDPELEQEAVNLTTIASGSQMIQQLVEITTSLIAQST